MERWLQTSFGTWKERLEKRLEETQGTFRKDIWGVQMHNLKTSDFLEIKDAKMNTLKRPGWRENHKEPHGWAKSFRKDWRNDCTSNNFWDQRLGRAEKATEETRSEKNDSGEQPIRRETNWTDNYKERVKRRLGVWRKAT